MKTIIGQFKPSASLPQQALVMIFDLEGFSKFFSQPDVQDYVPKFMNIVLSAIESCFNGVGTAYWLPSDDKQKDKAYVKFPEVIHSKFLGDGALYIWSYNSFTEMQRVYLINRLWKLKTYFHKIVEKAADEIPILDIPKNIRFGISAGTIYKLTYANSNKEEYVGYSINLASRLQSYCRQIGITISGRVNIKTDVLERSNYIKVIVKNIKGFPQEVVVVDKHDYDKLDADTRAAIFELIGSNHNGQ